MHREKTVPCSDPKCEVVSHFKLSRTRHPLCTGSTCRHGGGCLATGQPGFQPSLAVPKVYVVSKTPPASRPALLPCPARAPTAKLSPPPLASGPVQLLLPASGDLKAGGSRASDLSLQEVGSPATGVPQAGDVLGVELRTQGGDNSSSPAFESLVPRAPPAGDGTGGRVAGGGPRGPASPARSRVWEAALGPGPRLSLCSVLF